MLLSIASACVCLLCFAATREALAQHSTLRYPSAIALPVSVLAFIGMQGLGNGVIRLLLLPAIAMALLLSAACMIWALGKRQGNSHQSANGAGAAGPALGFNAGAALNSLSGFEAALKSGAQVLGRIGSELANAISDLWNRPGKDGKGLAIILAAVALGVVMMAALLLVQILPIALMILVGVALYRAIRHNSGIR